jgi:energy-coupling factor transport system permease protein
MSVLNDLTLGQYIDGDSPLHRLDPRLKLAGTVFFIIAVFSGTHAIRLLLLGTLALVLAAVSGVGGRRWWRGIRALRWLFLFSILLHLFFSPGRTLWGVEWISYDGLIRGGVVSCQLGLAVVFSSLLTFTTAPERIAAAFSRLCSPLSRLGVPIEEGARLVLLILYFIPVLREEAATAIDAARSRSAVVTSRLHARIRILKEAIPPLILRLVERADELAHACARGEKIPGEGVILPPLRAAGLLSMAAIGVFSFILIFLP